MASTLPRVELLLARNLIAAILTPAFIVDAEGNLTFYNDAAGELIGHRFEESGRLTREEWRQIGPVDEQGRGVEGQEMPLTLAARSGHPAHGRFRILTDQGGIVQVDASAMPIMGADGYEGVLVAFVPVIAATEPS